MLADEIGSSKKRSRVLSRIRSPRRETAVGVNNSNSHRSSRKPSSPSPASRRKSSPKERDGYRSSDDDATDAGPSLDTPQRREEEKLLREKALKALRRQGDDGSDDDDRDGGGERRRSGGERRGASRRESVDSNGSGVSVDCISQNDDSSNSRGGRVVERKKVDEGSRRADEESHSPSMEALRQKVKAKLRKEPA